MPDFGNGGFVMEGGVLRCPYDMNVVPPRDLKAWCDRLLACTQPALSIDLSGTRHIASHHLGVIAQAWSDAVGRGKRLVVRITPDLRRVFEMSGLDQVVDLAEV